MKVNKQDVVLSGGFGKTTNSARAGDLPMHLERAPLEIGPPIDHHRKEVAGVELGGPTLEG